jgi:hypothetical protein
MSEEPWEAQDGPDELAVKLADLGTPLAEFSVRGWRFVGKLLAAGLAGVAGLAILGGVLFAVRQRFAAGLFKLVALGLALDAASVFLSLRAWRSRGLRVLVYPEGLVTVRRGRVKALFWDEVVVVWRKKTTGAWGWMLNGSLVYTLAKPNGEEVHFDDTLPNLTRLGELVQTETLKVMLPRAREVLRRGEALDFQKVRLSSKGLHNGAETLRWPEVKKIEFGGNQFAVIKKDKWMNWLTALVAEIPNVHLLQALVWEARQLESSFELKGVEDWLVRPRPQGRPA